MLHFKVSNNFCSISAKSFKTDIFTKRDCGTTCFMLNQGGCVPDIASLLAGGFTEETARKLYAQGEEMGIFVMLQLAALVVKANACSAVQSSVNGVSPNDVHPSQPPGSVAVFLKPSRKKRRKKPVVIQNIIVPPTKIELIRRIACLADNQKNTIHLYIFTLSV
jgi:hypothetical protein